MKAEITPAASGRLIVRLQAENEAERVLLQSFVHQNASGLSIEEHWRDFDLSPPLHMIAIGDPSSQTALARKEGATVVVDGMRITRDEFFVRLGLPESL